eukprot:1555825-Pyramimonas_sp.AAC.1
MLTGRAFPRAPRQASRLRGGPKRARPLMLMAVDENQEEVRSSCHSLCDELVAHELWASPSAVLLGVLVSGLSLFRCVAPCRC